MVFVVGLAGPGKVGKSTTAKNIVATFNIFHPSLKVGRYAFAQPIYEVTAELTGISIDTLKNEIYKETSWSAETAPVPCLIDWSPRKLLQIIGTECFRNNVNPDFWIQTALNKIKNLDIAIIEDARFTNEFSKCNLVVELFREGVDYTKTHASAMPPDPQYVAERLHLSHGMDYQPIVSIIMERFHAI